MLEGVEGRKRPLTAEMLHYACSTSHYNLMMFSRLLAQLKEKQKEGQHNSYIVGASERVQRS